MSNPNADAALDYLNERIAGMVLNGVEAEKHSDVLTGLALASIALAVNKAITHAIEADREFAERINNQHAN